MELFKLLIFCIYLFRCLNVAISGNSADSEIACQFPDNQATSGKCINAKKCPYAIGNLKVGLSPISCKSEKDPYAVCCPTSKRISEQKCESYTNIFRQRRRRKRKLILESGKKVVPKTNHTTSEKGHEHGISCPLFLPTRISGGRDAFKQEYPHQVALGYGPMNKVAWRCGGVLISSNFIATAGHCATTKYGAPVKILLGDRFLSKEENPARMIVGVESIFTHPEYKPPLLYNDLALIKLTSHVPLSRSILPACLPQPQFRLDKKNTVTVTGFGQLGAMDSGSDILQSVDLKKFAASECSEVFMNDTATRSRLVNGVMPSQFCAGDKEGSKDSCHGDSGSGAVVTTNYPCVFYVVGITSFGSSLCGMQQPGVYTNVLRYLDWIENIVWPITRTTTENRATSQTTTPATSENTTHKESSSAAKSTPKYIPRDKRPKTTRRPVFMADTPQTVHPTQSIKTTEISTTPTTAVPFTTPLSPASPKPHHNITPTHSTTTATRPTHSTAVLKPHKLVTPPSQGNTLNPTRTPAETSALVNTILGYDKNITTAKSINNVTSNVSNILSIVHGI